MTTAQSEARSLVELIAGPLRLGDNVKAALARVSVVTGLGDRRVRAIWNNEARAIRADEMDRLRQVALDNRTREEADRAYRAHLARLAAAQEALRVPYPVEGSSADRRLGGVARGADRALDQGAAR
ncbi:hypothetical protein Q8W71_17580 [Methylobacterium sp. NEAU 140]|uniref:hypothetical protein n=1 Tax=Methylobacterium sp. NEAU 140 TaxID=3064945 RepID=UPI00273731C9|nr:hypothetical protein [Methylobacterium sp. NEAU 140]MDP4024439.1 hypothetical protein [Methylobacterium sp. NEAU 140]